MDRESFNNLLHTLQEENGKAHEGIKQQVGAHYLQLRNNIVGPPEVRTRVMERLSQEEKEEVERQTKEDWSKREKLHFPEESLEAVKKRLEQEDKVKQSQGTEAKKDDLGEKEQIRKADQIQQNQAQPMPQQEKAQEPERKVNEKIVVEAKYQTLAEKQQQEKEIAATKEKAHDDVETRKKELQAKLNQSRDKLNQEFGKYGQEREPIQQDSMHGQKMEDRKDGLDEKEQTRKADQIQQNQAAPIHEQEKAQHQGNEIAAIKEKIHNDVKAREGELQDKLNESRDKLNHEFEKQDRRREPIHHDGKAQ